MKKKNEKEVQEAELKAGIKDMSFGKKLEYFWMYDKWILAVVIVVIALAIGIYQWYDNSKVETVLTIAAINSSLDDPEPLQQSIREELNLTDKYKKVTVNVSLQADKQTGELDYYSQMAYLAQAQAHAMDVLIMNESVAKKMQDIQSFVPIEEILGEDSSKVASYIEGSCLNVSETMVPKLYGVEEPAYLGVLVYSAHREECVRYLRTLFPELNK